MCIYYVFCNNKNYFIIIIWVQIHWTCLWFPFFVATKWALKKVNFFALYHYITWIETFAKQSLSREKKVKDSVVSEAGSDKFQRILINIRHFFFFSEIMLASKTGWPCDWVHISELSCICDVRHHKDCGCNRWSFRIRSIPMFDAVLKRESAGYTRYALQTMCSSYRLRRKHLIDIREIY